MVLSRWKRISSTFREILTGKRLFPSYSYKKWTLQVKNIHLLLFRRTNRAKSVELDFDTITIADFTQMTSTPASPTIDIEPPAMQVIKYSQPNKCFTS